MGIQLATSFFGGAGQGGRQIIELFTAFGLAALIGLEREIQGKSAGLRTQSIVGTSAALIMLVSKYGFSDVLSAGTVILDPSRVAAQIVSGIGFLGAGIIITRRGAVQGLTTAAAIWEAAAIGMATGAGLLLLGIVVTAMHFLIVLGFAPLARRLTSRVRGSIRVHVVYQDGRGILRQLLHTCALHRWQLTSLAADPPGAPFTGDSLSPAIDGQVGVMMTLSGARILDAARVLASVEGVTRIEQIHDDSE
jgi:putative Mg2+ transporter-C (MgtC) family protein